MTPTSSRENTLTATPSQFALAHAIAELLPKDAFHTTRQMNALFHAAQVIATALRQKPVMASPGMGLGAWLSCDDTGSSSLFMAAALFPLKVPSSTEVVAMKAHPHDPADFGKCVRFLEAIPEAAARLSEVGECGGPVWQRLVANWSELTILYKRTDGEALYAKMKAFISPGP